MGRRRRSSLLKNKSTLPVAPAPAAAKPPDGLQQPVVSEDAKGRQNLDNTQTASQAELPSDASEEVPASTGSPPVSAPAAPSPDAAELAPPAEPDPTPRNDAPEEEPAADPTPAPPESFRAAAPEATPEASKAAPAGATPSQLSNHFETPSGADWFMRTGQPAPAREDVVVAEPSQKEVAPPPPPPPKPSMSTAQMLIGGVLIVAAGCFFALVALVWLVFG